MPENPQRGGNNPPRGGYAVESSGVPFDPKTFNKTPKAREIAPQIFNKPTKISTNQIKGFAGQQEGRWEGQNQMEHSRLGCVAQSRRDAKEEGYLFFDS